MIKSESRSGYRKLARMCIVMCLYQHDVTGDSIRKVTNDFLSMEIDQLIDMSSLKIANVSKARVKGVLEKVSQNQSVIDKEIKLNLTKDWTFSRIDRVVVSVLRAAVCELLFFKEVPSKVLFKEYVDIAGCFLSVDDVHFVTAILNNIARRHRVDELFQAQEMEE